MGPVAVLDDYQGVAAGCADWQRLERPVEFFREHIGGTGELVERLASFEVVVVMRERTPLTRDILARLPELRLIVTTGTGNAAIDVDAAADLGILVCGTRSPGHATAELAFTLVQVLARNIVDEVASVRSGGWQVGLGRDIRGATLGVVGLGRLGSEAARLGLAHGMDVIAWSQNLTSKRAGEAGVRSVSKDELFAGSDFVTIHLRLSDRTRGLVGRSELELMKRSAFLVNTSRGPIVDESALLEALSSGSPAAAAIDVFDREPLPPDHPFRSHPRILPTPHIGYVTQETYRVFYPDAVEDIEAWSTGNPVRVVSPVR